MADLTTLDAVRGYLGIDDPSETDADGQIGRLISSESARFIALSGNPILQASYTDTRDGNGTRYLLPQAAWTRCPLVSVQSLTIDGVTIPQRVSIDDVGWQIVDGRIELSGYVFTGGRTLFDVGPGPSFTGLARGVGNVKIAYTAGYAEVPAEVEQAVIEMVAIKTRGRGRIGVQTQSVQGESASFQPNPWAEIQSVIDAYSRPVI